MFYTITKSPYYHAKVGSFRKRFALAGGGMLTCPILTSGGHGADIYFNEYRSLKNGKGEGLEELPDYLEERPSFDRKA